MLLVLTLHQLMRCFSQIYGVRNAFLSGLPEKVNLLFISVTDVQNILRRNPRPDLLRIAHARLVARVGCIVDHFHDGLPLTDAMMRKFPAAGCAYCHTKPCTCGETRPEPSLLAYDPVQYEWTLNQWTSHMDAVYGDRNRRKGEDYVLQRLTNELGELLSLALRLPADDRDQADILNEFADELADVLSWIMTSSNVLGLDLGESVASRYHRGCTSCHMTPCRCMRFSRRQVSWDKITVETLPPDAPSEHLPRD